MNPTSTSSSRQKKSKIAPAIITMPTANCLCWSVPLPKGLKSKDTQGFAEGVILQNSMLPIEQTAWGYLADPKQKTLFVFATLRDLVTSEIKKLGKNPLGHIFPTFIALCNQRRKVEGWRILNEGSCFTALYFELNDLFPRKIISLYEEEGNALSIFNEKHSIKVPKDQIFHLKSFQLQNNGSVSVDMEHINGSRKNRALNLPDKQVLLGADLRDKDLLSKQLSEERNRKTLKIALYCCSLIALLMLFFQIKSSSLASSAEEMNAKVKQNKKLVEHIKNKESLIKVIKRFGEEPFRPFDWVMLVNQSRSEDIAFSSMKVTADKSISIAGTAPLVKEINAYKDLLLATDNFTKVEITKLNSQSGSVEFIIELSCKENWPTFPKPEIIPEETATKEIEPNGSTPKEVNVGTEEVAPAASEDEELATIEETTEEVK